jgi:hypothetical protein
VRRLIQEKVLTANQVVPCAPWQIPIEALATKSALKAVADIGKRARRPQSTNWEDERLLFSGA